MGDLNVYDPANNESQTLSFEARGDVTVPPGMRCALVVSDEACFDLSPLAALRLDDLHFLHLWHEEVVDEHLEHIKRLRFLEELLLLGQFTDVGLQYLGNLTGLRRLTLVIEGSHTTDAGLVFLKNLSELDSLYLLSEGTFSNAGLAYVVTLKKLRHLSLRGTLIDGVGLSYLCQLPLLTRLWVSHAEIFDSDLAQNIHRLANLTGLGLDATHITDDGLTYLQGLKNLQHLDLSSCEITDSGLVHLQNLTAVDLLDLSHTNIAQTAINRLQEALPNCRILTRDR